MKFYHIHQYGILPFREYPDLRLNPTLLDNRDKIVYLIHMELEIHPAQANILKTLLFKRRARFSELNITSLSSDHFNFHIQKLLEIGLIEKEAGGYKLTIQGKEFSNRLDTDTVLIEKQPKIGVLLVGTEKDGNKIKYLIQQRLKHPYFGYFGFPTGKIKWGETILETAKRELYEETGLGGKLVLVGIKHKLDYSKEKNLLEDKYFFVFKAYELTGKLTRNFEGGKNIWLTKQEINNLQNLFDGVAESIDMVNHNNLMFSETKYTVSGF